MYINHNHDAQNCTGNDALNLIVQLRVRAYGLVNVRLFLVYKTKYLRSFKPLIPSIQYIDAEEQKNKSMNKAKTKGEQRTKEKLF